MLGKFTFQKSSKILTPFLLIWGDPSEYIRDPFITADITLNHINLLVGQCKKYFYCQRSLIKVWCVYFF